MINPNDLRLLAHDCFDSLVKERSINEQLVSKLKGDISHYLATGTNNGLNEETLRLIDSLIKYLDYQLETRVQSVSVEASHLTSIYLLPLKNYRHAQWLKSLETSPTLQPPVVVVRRRLRAIIRICLTQL